MMEKVMRIRKCLKNRRSLCFPWKWRGGELTRYRKIALGNLLITCAYAFITVPHGIINGGTTSFAMILSQCTGWAIPVIVNSVTVLLLLLCRIFLGKVYLIGALFSGFCYMALFSALESLHWSLPLPLPLCVPLAALLVGAGYALCISAQSTALGFDTIALILHKRYKRLNVSWLMFGINMIILLLGFAIYGGLSIAFGIVFTFLQTRILNTIMAKTAKEPQDG